MRRYPIRSLTNKKRIGYLLDTGAGPRIGIEHWVHKGHDAIILYSEHPIGGQMIQARFSLDNLPGAVKAAVAEIRAVIGDAPATILSPTGKRS